MTIERRPSDEDEQPRNDTRTYHQYTYTPFLTQQPAPRTEPDPVDERQNGSWAATGTHANGAGQHADPGYQGARVDGAPVPVEYLGPGYGSTDRAGDGRAPEADADRPRRGGIGRTIGWLGPLLLLAATKMKWLLVIFKFKAFTTFATMAVSIWAYALFFGLPFAVGLVALLFIHEMGHALVLKRQGVKATAPLFIPFMGAVIGMKEMPKNVYNEALMALGGPVVGSLGALACLVLWQVTGSALFVALAYLGLWLNLFNLIPVSPLDGGRAMGAISPWGWLVGLALLLVLFLRGQSLFLGFILLVGGMEVYNRWRGRHAARAYYEITGRQRLTITLVYFGLAATLALLMAALEPAMVDLRPDR